MRNDINTMRVDGVHDCDHKAPNRASPILFPGVGTRLVLPIRGCATNVGRVFSNFGVSMGRKLNLPHFPPNFCCSLIHQWVAFRHILENLV